MSEKRPYFGRSALITHESSHDTFDETKHFNWLCNGAGVGTYSHGRIHQQVGNTVYVGDLIHKRGHLSTSDLLLMEEQSLLSMGEPLSAPSSFGALVTMETLPATGTSYGEGSLIGYYEGGVVSFETQEIPRETRHDGEGTVIQKGWDTKRMVTHLLNMVSAVGRYAVAVLPRDHLFRSSRGLHLLKQTMGAETFNSENVNSLSQDVSPILDADTTTLLSGAAVGFWAYGNRYFATTGFVSVPEVAALPAGRGFVSWNQAVSYTEDRTPRPAWEGLWVVDSGIVGIHRFVETTVRPSRNTFGFLCSDASGKVFLAKPDPSSETDVRDGKILPVEWSFETAQFSPSGGKSLWEFSDGCLELLTRASASTVRVFARTDKCGEWTLWKRITLDFGTPTLTQEALGRPPQACREGSWIQVRVEGLGACEIRRLDIDTTESVVKARRSRRVQSAQVEKDFFEINQSPAEQRWQ